MRVGARLLSTHIRACYLQKPTLGLAYIGTMSEAPLIGQTRSKPDSDGASTEPLEKKPKLTPPSGNTKKLSKKGAAKEKKRKLKTSLPEPFSSEDVLWRDVVSLLGKDTVDK